VLATSTYVKVWVHQLRSILHTGFHNKLQVYNYLKAYQNIIINSINLKHDSYHHMISILIMHFHLIHIIIIISLVPKRTQPSGFSFLGAYHSLLFMFLMPWALCPVVLHLLCWFLFLMTWGFILALLPWGFILSGLILALLFWGFILNGLTHALSNALGLYTQWSCTYLFLMPWGSILSGLKHACFFLMPWGFIPSGLTHALYDAQGLYTSGLKQHIFPCTCFHMLIRHFSNLISCFFTHLY